MRPDLNARQNARVHSNVSAESNPNRLDDQTGCNDRYVDRFGGMSRTQDLCSRTPSHVIFQDDVPRIKVGLWANPNVIANPAGSVEASLDHGLSANKHRMSKFHGLGMLQHNAGSNLEVVANGFAESAHRNPSHHTVEDALTRSILPK